MDTTNRYPTLTARTTTAPIEALRVGHRDGDRVVAVTDITATTITVHGHGTYRHTTGVTDPTVIDALTNAVDSSDRRPADLTGLLDTITRNMSPAWAQRTRQRAGDADRRHRAIPPAQRAARYASIMHDRRRVDLDDGRVVDADTCMLISEDTFARYATGCTIVTA